MWIFGKKATGPLASGAVTPAPAMAMATPTFKPGLFDWMLLAFLWTGLVLAVCAYFKNRP